MNREPNLGSSFSLEDFGATKSKMKNYFLADEFMFYKLGYFFLNYQ